MRDYRKLLENRKGQREQIQQQLEIATKRLGLTQETLLNLEASQTIIQHVAKVTQSSLQFSISNLVTLALSDVFGKESYMFEVCFVDKRNQTEADLWFVREGERIDPLSASGGGTVDIAAFALRIALWSLMPNRTRPIMILDEPMRNLSEEYQEKASQLIKEISERMRIQFVMVTHVNNLVESADKVFTIQKKNGVSYASVSN